MDEIIGAIKDYAMNNTLLAIAKPDEHTLRKSQEQAERLERIKNLIRISQQDEVIRALREVLGERSK